MGCFLQWAECAKKLTDTGKAGQCPAGGTLAFASSDCEYLGCCYVTIGHVYMYTYKHVQICAYISNLHARYHCKGQWAEGARRGYGPLHSCYKNFSFKLQYCSTALYRRGYVHVDRQLQCILWNENTCWEMEACFGPLEGLDHCAHVITCQLVGEKCSYENYFYNITKNVLIWTFSPELVANYRSCVRWYIYAYTQYIYLKVEARVGKKHSRRIEFYRINLSVISGNIAVLSLSVNDS